MATKTYKYSGNVYEPTTATTTFALTSSAGNSIEYLEKEYIHVYRSTDSGATYTELDRPDDWDFSDDGRSVVVSSFTPNSGDFIKVQRITPFLEKYTTFAQSSLLTSEQLNDGEEFSMYVDQEIADGVAFTNDVAALLTEAEATADPTDPDWSGDQLIPTVGAVERVFKQVVGPGADFPGDGNKAKLGQLRIDNTGAEPSLFYWDADAATPAWVQIRVDGTPGPPGPAATVDVDPNTVTGDAGTNASVVNTGTTSAAVFQFTIPRGDQGERGPEGPEGQRGPQGQGVNYLGGIDPTQPNSEPSNPANGDFYVSTASGATTWTGLSVVADGTRLIWNAQTSQWDAYTPVGNTDLVWIPAPAQGTIFNSVGTDAVVTLVDSTNAGLMSPGQKGELDTALQPGDNISELNNDAGFITAGDVPATGVTSVNGDAGPAVVLDAADVGAIPLGSWASIPALT